MRLTSTKWGATHLFKKGYTFIFLIFFGGLSSCDNPTEENAEENNATNATETVVETTAETEDDVIPQVQIPEGYEILKEAMGDLDGDGIDEKVIVFNTHRPGEMGDERELCIYAVHEGLWSLWHSAVGPVLSSERGGLLGDPFDDLSIRNGEIEILHYGGSVDRWSYSHGYKFIDDHWYLVDASLTYFQICNYSETYTYDLLKGTGYHSRQKDECDDNGSVTKTTMEVEETLVISESNERPMMEGFNPGDVEVMIEGQSEGYRY